MTATVRQEKFFISSLPGSDVAVEAFKAAKFVYMKTPYEIITYSLLSTREIMPALLYCVNAHLSKSNNVSSALPKALPSPSQPAPSPNLSADAEAARVKLLKDLGQEFNNCINLNMKEIVPYSREGAETIAQVIVTKCSEIQKKFVDLSVALHGGTRENAAKIIEQSVGEREKSIVADIVTFRAELTKAIMSQPKGSAPNSTPTPAGQGL